MPFVFSVGSAVGKSEVTFYRMSDAILNSVDIPPPPTRCNTFTAAQAFVRKGFEPRVVKGGGTSFVMLYWQAFCLFRQLSLWVSLLQEMPVDFPFRIQWNLHPVIKS
jgi:hypothetical protein